MTSRVLIADIITAVCAYRKVRQAKLIAWGRSQPVVRYRQEAMALAREMTAHSTPVIARHFNRRDHTTVLYACRKIAADAADPAYAAELAALRACVFSQITKRVSKQAGASSAWSQSPPQRHAAMEIAS